MHGNFPWQLTVLRGGGNLPCVFCDHVCISNFCHSLLVAAYLVCTNIFVVVVFFL